MTNLLLFYLVSPKDYHGDFLVHCCPPKFVGNCITFSKGGNGLTLLSSMYDISLVDTEDLLLFEGMPLLHFLEGGVMFDTVNSSQF